MGLKISKLPIEGYEEVIEAIDETVGLHAFIAIHNTRLGPALGGTRIYPYPSSKEALDDALRLARAMTFKSALAATHTGGGKGVIISRGQKSKELLHAYAEVINSLSGRFITGEDMGSNCEDIITLREKTPYVVGLNIPNLSGDPSRFAAFGVFSAMKRLMGAKGLKGSVVALLGLGAVGMKLATHLFWAGADLVVADIDQEKCAYAQQHFAAQIVPVDEICAVPCAIFSPCALGGILNEKSISRLRCRAVIGSANNQLDKDEDGLRLYERGIDYAPDFVVNAGGLLSVAGELSACYSPKVIREKTEEIGKVIEDILLLSKMEKKAPSLIAIQMAEQKLTAIC